MIRGWNLTKIKNQSTKNSTLQFQDRKISKRELRKRKAASKKALYVPFLKQYARLKKQVKQRYIKAKDIYCDLPGDQIEAKNYARDKAFSYRDGPNRRIDNISVPHSRAMFGKLKKPKLLVVKEKLEKFWCL